MVGRCIRTRVCALCACVFLDVCVFEYVCICVRVHACLYVFLLVRPPAHSPVRPHVRSPDRPPTRPLVRQSARTPASHAGVVRINLPSGVRASYPVPARPSSHGSSGQSAAAAGTTVRRRRPDAPRSPGLGHRRQAAPSLNTPTGRRGGDGRRDVPRLGHFPLSTRPSDI